MGAVVPCFANPPQYSIHQAPREVRGRGVAVLFAANLSLPAPKLDLLECFCLGRQDRILGWRYSMSNNSVQINLLYYTGPRTVSWVPVSGGITDSKASRAHSLLCQQK